MEPGTARTQVDSRVLQAAVERGLISPQVADEAAKQGAATNTLATELLIRQGVLTKHIVDNLAGTVPAESEPQAIAGFKITGRLGQGGMGTVYRALQVSMNRVVALKVIARQFAADAAFCDRFLREARAAGQVNHPNVITCYDVGQDQGWLYMALELMTGGDAASAARKGGGRVDEARALRIIADGARGLVALKRAGLIHRDIKPANIFISEDGIAKLGDLGLARSTSGDDRMTMTGAAMGTPAFMSPEQASGEAALDIRTDIYALGATLFSLLTGDTPYKGASAFAVVAKVINDPVPDPRAITPAISDGAAAVILKAMAKDRAVRYASPEEMIEDLERVLTGRDPRHAPLVPRPAGVASGEQAQAIGAAVTTPGTIPGAPQRSVEAPTAPTAALAATIIRRPDAPAAPVPAHPTPPASGAARRGPGLWIGAGIGVAAVVALAVVLLRDGPAPAAPAGQTPGGAGAAPDPFAFPTPAPAQPAPVATTPRPAPRTGEGLGDELALTPGATPSQRPAPATLELPPDPVPPQRPVAQASPAPTRPVSQPQPQPAPSQPSAEPAKAEPLARTVLDGYRTALSAHRLVGEVADAGDGRTIAVKLDRGTRDLKGLAGLPISALHLDDCRHLEGVADLRGLPLRVLSLRNCDEIADLSGLAGMALQALDLTNCASVADISVLRGMPIAELRLGGCKSLASLAGIEGLRFTAMDLTDCRRLTSIDALRGMPLTQLSLVRCTRLPSLDALAGMPLQALDLTGCETLTTLAPLRGMALARLPIDDCRRLTTLDGLQGMPLTELTLKKCYALADLSGLKGGRLQRLSLFRCDALASLAGLDGNPLSVIDITQCELLAGDLSALSGLPLREVSIRECAQLVSLRGLEMPTLKKVVIVQCKRLTDIVPAVRPGVEIVRPE